MRLSSGYHPETNRQTEQLNQELEAALSCVSPSERKLVVTAVALDRIRTHLP